MTVASPARAHTATLVVVGPVARLEEAEQTVAGLDEAGSVRSVLIPTDGAAMSGTRLREDFTVRGVKPEYLNNAIAALRLSSLPTVIWWRGGQPDRLDGVAPLADRVVLDAEDPAPLWSRAPALFERAAITDIRWARLTRWRSVMAHFFDLPDVRKASPTLSRLEVVGADRPQCTLFAGWLDASLRWEGRVAVEIVEGGPPAALSAVTLTGADLELSMRLLANHVCVDTTGRVDTHALASHVVSLGEEDLASLLSQELRVRSRDVAFEQALRSTAFLGI
jgi:glucose-6-phosphate dehydrogenase assembly protein OpcA